MPFGILPIKNPLTLIIRGIIFKWWRGVELNHRHKAFQASALPLSYPARYVLCAYSIEKWVGGKFFALADLLGLSRTLFLYESARLYSTEGRDFCRPLGPTAPAAVRLRKWGREGYCLIL